MCLAFSGVVFGIGLMLVLEFEVQNQFNGGLVGGGAVVGMLAGMDLMSLLHHESGLRQHAGGTGYHRGVRCGHH